MKNPFSLADDHLKTLLNSYSAWSQGHEQEKDYAKIQRKLAQELKKKLLNKRYLSNMSDDELYQSIFDHSRSVEGPAYIRLGEPRIRAEKDKVRKENNWTIGGRTTLRD